MPGHGLHQVFAPRGPKEAQVPGRTDLDHPPLYTCAILKQVLEGVLGPGKGDNDFKGLCWITHELGENKTEPPSFTSILPADCISSRLSTPALDPTVVQHKLPSQLKITQNSPPY